MGQCVIMGEEQSVIFTLSLCNNGAITTNKIGEDGVN